VLLSDSPVVSAPQMDRLLSETNPERSSPAHGPHSGADALQAGLLVRPYADAASHRPEQLAEALARHGGNRSRAAQSLGLTLRQFSYRCQKLGLA
jgi:Nif-specific regulatory protein